MSGDVRYRHGAAHTGFHVHADRVALLGAVCIAIDTGRKLETRYQDGTGAVTERAVRPLGLFFWGSSWSMAGWCELRRDFRNFRLDRIESLVQSESRFVPEPGRTLEGCLRREGEE